MRVYWSLLVLSLSLPFCSTAMADSTTGQSLQNYRAKATYSLPSACVQAGGTVVYTAHTPECKLPTLSSKTPSAVTTPARATPLSAQH
ncbi:hypothetical protein [Telmatospirillum siberiense]|uniref:Uncharacterized protein n=1 Tax=Telmatospirillum siberiense TaxID=382514 RepID=A0A2N3PR08_9PROT|nr:hypothetical protein [Telmatospirillum siberiense]PKU22839.1 hypothetical protein CWS72_19485 [Telmatospirillum siberiense]